MMTCLEAQSMITAFIEDNLDDKELIELIQHMRQCPDCKEELEVYYTLMVGMKQLDNNEKLSNNFAEELERKLSYHENRIRGHNRRVMKTKATVSIVITTVLVFVLFQLGTMIHNLNKPNTSGESGKYYYMNVKPHLFYPDDFKLRNPYGGINEK